jgi:glycosyltransferase involved in cell wall biosynthesis
VGAAKALPVACRGLFVTPMAPRDPRQGARGVFRRQRLLLDALAQACDAIDVLLFVNPRETPRPTETEVAAALLPGFRGPLRVRVCDRDPPSAQAGPWSRYLLPATGFARLPDYAPFAGAAQRDACEAMLARAPHVVLAHRLRAMAPLLRARAALPPLLLDLDDVEHIAFARAVLHPPVWGQKLLTYLQLPALCAGEARAFARAQRVLVCSEADRRHLRRWFRARAEVLENALALPPVPAPAGRDLLFVGSYEYPPNRLAAEHLLDAIWPRIRARAPHATLTLAGPDAQRVRHFARPPQGVRFAGFVADLDALYAAAALVVCPVRSGGGTRVKLVEAAGYGKAIVSTTLGAEGLELRDGIDALLRDDPDEFATACADLLADPARAAALGMAARATALARFDRERAVARLRGWLAQAAQGHPAGAARAAARLAA